MPSNKAYITLACRIQIYSDTFAIHLGALGLGFVANKTQGEAGKKGEEDNLFHNEIRIELILILHIPKVKFFIRKI
jgi:hypothetical protein